ncbi:hypothetical protein H7F51_16150 [Novosphingobium flavum]|uniref:Glycerophosphoryl diester phosphodiesterase membrane domain-containing protein n=1 Tax=Novosphingobium flavum TaxID=1778672 RepID=A0A7X1FU68_9SPHN|nr:hypothetical protein [Novosphingobium flavum]MBC2667051.1 hypothetical protein [Novosphingobium flavum]
MIFDSNQAWQQATAAIRANREVLFALSGVFYLLPILAFSLLFPQPSPPAGADQQAMLAFAADYYAQTMPVSLPMALVQAAGTLGLLTLMTDRSRPTVGEAIRLGFVALLPYLGSQILFGFAAGGAALAVLTVLGLTGSQVLVSAGLAAMIVAGIYLWVRTSLAAPVIAVEQMRSPLRALRRSWALTRGNGGRVLVFYALIVLTLGLVMAIVMGLVGIVLALVMPAHAARIVAAVISAALEAGMGLTFVAALAATHAQLAGPGEDRLSATFD